MVWYHERLSLEHLFFHLLLKPDLCVYVFKDKIDFAILMLYVGNIILLDNDKQLFGKLKKKQTDHFEITGLGDVSRATIRRPLHSQPAGKGNVQVLESSHGRGQTCTPILNRVRVVPNHLHSRQLRALATYNDANRRANPDNGKSTYSYIMILANGLISFKVGLQSLTARLTMGAELVAGAIAMKESLFCSNMMVELGFKKGFESVSVYINKTLALHVAGNWTFSPRAKHIALRYFFVQELVKEEKLAISTM